MQHLSHKAKSTQETANIHQG